MLPIYICEDEPQVRGVQRAYLEKQILIEGYDMEIVECTGQPEKILEKMSQNPGRGICFLDVELKGASMDGFALGQEIRKRDTRGFLIYVTAFQDLAFETFRYHLEVPDYICKQDAQEMHAGAGTRATSPFSADSQSLSGSGKPDRSGGSGAQGGGFEKWRAVHVFQKEKTGENKQRSDIECLRQTRKRKSL